MKPATLRTPEARLRTSTTAPPWTPPQRRKSTEIVMHPDVLFDGWIKYFLSRMKTIEDYGEKKLGVNNLLKK